MRIGGGDKIDLANGADFGELRIPTVCYKRYWK